MKIIIGPNTQNLVLLVQTQVLELDVVGQVLVLASQLLDQILLCGALFASCSNENLASLRFLENCFAPLANKFGLFHQKFRTGNLSKKKKKNLQLVNTGGNQIPAPFFSLNKLKVKRRYELSND